jgi:hypothetical protein
VEQFFDHARSVRASFDGASRQHHSGIFHIRRHPAFAEGYFLYAVWCEFAAITADPAPA